MSDKSSGSGGGISFLGMLTILFIGLKLTGHIDWSWWWVLCPIWAFPAILLAILAVCGIGLGIITVIEAIAGEKFKRGGHGS